MHSETDRKSIILVLPSVAGGGMERVMVELSKEFIDVFELDVYLILLTRNKQYYKFPDKVRIIEPDFDYKDFNGLIRNLKTSHFLRKSIKSTLSKTVLSFGGKYNAFVLISCLGLNTNVYVSDRSRPGISYGKFLDLLNPIIYRLAKGIIAQTEIAKRYIYERTKHENIKVIGNPIKTIEYAHDGSKDNIILNVGRFINSKHQQWLINYFIEMNLKDWKLVFLGDGPLFDTIKNLPQVKRHSDRIFFKGNVSDIDYFYNVSKIFAFTSTSEGFPNALAEAMKSGLACISYNCDAGPSDLIDHGKNGFLIEMGHHSQYKSHLAKLCSDEELRNDLGNQAKLKMKLFESVEIANQFLNFCFKDT